MGYLVEEVWITVSWCCGELLSSCPCDRFGGGGRYPYDESPDVREEQRLGGIKAQKWMGLGKALKGTQSCVYGR